MQLIKSPKEYDVVIVGSGAGGGMAAKVLSDAGLNIAIVEAGSHYDPADPKYKTQMLWPWQSPRRGASSTRAFGDFDASYCCLRGYLTRSIMRSLGPVGMTSI